MRVFCLGIALGSVAFAQVKVPRIWEDAALTDWATPIAALGVRPGHFTAAEYYAAPVDNFKTYPVYRPDKEPQGYWDWLQNQKPEPLVDAGRLRTKKDCIAAGREAFLAMDAARIRRSDPEAIRAARDPRSYDGVWTQADGSLLIARWVVTESGVQLGFTVCSACHSYARADGTVLLGAPLVDPPSGARTYVPKLPPRKTPVRFFVFEKGSSAMEFWRQFTVPWDPDPRVEQFRNASAPPPLVAIAPMRSVFARVNGSPWYMTKIPDLRTLRYNRYIDATGTHKLRGPADLARYGALVEEADPLEFGPHKIIEPDRRAVPIRFSDEALYAIGMFLLAQQPPKNPDPDPVALRKRGQQVFTKEGCPGCHTPPNYTTGKLTLATGYIAPVDHPNNGDIVNVSVGTDPGLAMKTRKGTGLYKIPSLRGVWYRPLLLHDGSVASLEEMFDPDRLKADHVPGGWKGPGVTKRSIPGHPFGLALNAPDKAALLAFLRSL